ncbi:UDP-3-O-(3-hydroxymyristoyl)glucosamine N-acyltransferase [Candidatus Nitrospira bockiana]
MSGEPAGRRISLKEIGETVGGRVVGRSDITITGVSSLSDAGPHDLAYIAADRFIPAARESKAAAFVAARDLSDLGRPHIVVPNPAYAFARITEHYFVTRPPVRGISPEAVRGRDVEIGPDPSIWPFVTIGDRVKIGARATLYPGVFLGDDTVLGDDCILYPNVTVREGCRLGSRVIAHSGTVIGSDGFGYVQHEGRHWKIPQLGIVVIEDDVELGANVTVDRATFGQTLIKRGTKIDNLVQVAHNVRVGEDCILVAQVGVAGSTTLGDHVIVGGQAGLADHLEIGDQTMIAARSGVNRSIGPRQVVSGAPIMPHDVAVKAHALIPRLPDLRQQLRNLEQRVRTLEAGQRNNAAAKRSGPSKRKQSRK